MEDSEEEELLNLSLSVAADREKKKKKGKSTTPTRENNNNNNIIASSNYSMMMNSSYNNNNNNNYYYSTTTSTTTTTTMMVMMNSSYEAKIFRLLQIRDHMLTQHHGNYYNTNNNGLPLIHLLLRAATSVDESNLSSALDHLTELYQSVSTTGDSVQRVVSYFCDALCARILTNKSPFYDMLMEDPTSEEQFLAFTDLYRVSPYYQFAHFTANQAILEAFEREEERNNRAIHVVDFDVSYGFQWPSLIQSLSEKATSGNRICLRVTGFGRNLKELQETESRLVSFSKGFHNLVFEFQGLLRGSRVINLRKKKNETVAVNLVSYLNTLTCFMKISDTLAFVHSLNPSIVVLVEQEGGSGIMMMRNHNNNNNSNSNSNSDISSSSCSGGGFLTRFRDSLQYYAAMFDSLDDCLPLESVERMRIERKLLGKEIKRFGGGGGGDGVKYERMETWKGRMENHGFVGNRMSSKCVIQAKLLLKMRTQYCPMQQFEDEEGAGGSNNGFRVCERDEGRAISLGWQNRFLLTVSAWQPLII